MCVVELYRWMDWAWRSCLELRTHHEVTPVEFATNLPYEYVWGQRFAVSLVQPFTTSGSWPRWGLHNTYLEYQIFTFTVHNRSKKIPLWSGNKTNVNTTSRYPEDSCHLTQGCHIVVSTWDLYKDVWMTALRTSKATPFQIAQRYESSSKPYVRKAASEQGRFSNLFIFIFFKDRLFSYNIYGLWFSTP